MEIGILRIHRQKGQRKSTDTPRAQFVLIFCSSLLHVYRVMSVSERRTLTALPVDRTQKQCSGWQTVATPQHGGARGGRGRREIFLSDPTSRDIQKRGVYTRAKLSSNSWTS